MRAGAVMDKGTFFRYKDAVFRKFAVYIYIM